MGVMTLLYAESFPTPTCTQRVSKCIFILISLNNRALFSDPSPNCSIPRAQKKTGGGAAGSSCSAWNLELRLRVLVQWRREVAFAGVGKDNDQRFSLALRSRRIFQSRRHCGSAADPRDDPLLFGQARRHLKGLFVGHGDDLVDELHVQHIGNETGAQALDAVLARLAAGEDRTVGRFDGDG